MAASPASKLPCAQAWCEGPDATGRTILFAACDSPESFAAFAWARANLLCQLDMLVLVHTCDKDRLFGGLNAMEGQLAISKYELSLDLKSKDALELHASRGGNVTGDYIKLSTIFTRREVVEFRWGTQIIQTVSY